MNTNQQDFLLSILKVVFAVLAVVVMRGILGMASDMGVYIPTWINVSLQIVSALIGYHIV